MEQLTVVIKPEHLIDSDYTSNEDCPLARALKEQYSNIGFPTVAPRIIGFWTEGPYEGKEIAAYRHNDENDWNGAVHEELCLNPHPLTLTLNKIF